MTKKSWVVLLSAALVLWICGCVSAKERADSKPPAWKAVSSFEGGKLYRAGKIGVVELTGNYRAMGRQYGGLLKADLQAMHRKIGEVFLDKGKMTPDQLAVIARTVFDRYPQRYREVLYGMAETSGLAIDEVLQVNAVEWFPKISRLSFGHCSGIAAWGPYTGYGPLVFGRNNDDDPLYREFAEKMVVAVFRPNDGSIPTALINYAGVIYNATGMNAEGLFLELNAGPWMGFSLERVSIFTTLFTYLQEYHDLAEFDRAMRSTLPELSSIITVADPGGACSFECSLYDTRRREQDEPGIIVAANAFSLPGWYISPLRPDVEPDQSQVRKANLLALGAKHKGAVNPAVLMAMLDVPITEGGATYKGTIYQVVAMPEQLKIWLKMPDIQDWTEIPLKPLMKK